MKLPEAASKQWENDGVAERPSLFIPYILSNDSDLHMQAIMLTRGEDSQGKKAKPTAGDMSRFADPYCLEWCNLHDAFTKHAVKDTAPETNIR